MYVKADATPETLEKIWNEAWKRSVVTQTVAREVKVTPSFEAL
jgi:hypothetical protein